MSQEIILETILPKISNYTGEGFWNLVRIIKFLLKPKESSQGYQVDGQKQSLCATTTAKFLDSLVRFGRTVPYDMFSISKLEILCGNEVVLKNHRKTHLDD